MADLKPGSFRIQLLARTLSFNFAAALLAVLLAIPAALVIGRGRGVTSGILIFAIPLSLLMPSVAYTYAWYEIAALLDQRFALRLTFPASPGDILRCVWTLGCWLWPVPAIIIGLSLRYLDSQVQQQALLDGALWRVTARQLLGPLVASLALVTILATQEFAVYERSGISVVSTEIRTVFDSGIFSSVENPIAAVSSGAARAEGGSTQSARAAAAVAAALPMLAIIVLLASVALHLPGRISAADAMEPAAWPRSLDTGPLPKLLTSLALLLTFILPIAAQLLLISPHRWKPDTLDHPWPLRIWLWAGPYAGGSLLAAVITGGLAFGIALLACVRRSMLLLALSALTFLVGGELLGIASIRLYNRPALSFIYNNLPILILAYLGRFAWLPLLAGNAAHARPLRELRDTASLDGATPWQATKRVILPLFWPILASSAVLVAILCLTEVGATVLISPQRPQVLVSVLMRWVHMLRYDDMLEGSLLLSAMALGLGSVFLMLLMLGVRLTRAATRRPLAMLLLVPLLVFGCDEGIPQPDAVWLETGTETGQVTYPRGIAYSAKDDCFFLVDRSGRIQRIEQGGEVSHVWRLGEYKQGFPVGLTIGPDNNLYVADTHYNRVLIYSPTGQLLWQFGSFGSGPGQFFFPMDVAFDSMGNIYVCETGGYDRIQVFTPKGEYLRQISSFGSEDGQLSRPVSLLIDERNHIYVTDASNHRIQVFDAAGKHLRTLGGIGSGLGQFRFPYGLAQDSHGRLVVAEFGNNRIQVLDKETGQGLRTIGAAGREVGQLAYPWAAVIDKDDRIVIVDSGNNRIQVFR
jgi:ABC-type Fe3+ transport system permease subunit/sugar lactone lactonase YvrE